MTDSAAAAAGIPFRLDRPGLKALHLLAAGVCALGFAFDLLEIALGSALSAVFSSPPHTVPALQLSMLLASVYVGAVVGAPLLGCWADRHGRRHVLMAAMLWLALTSVAGALSDGLWSLTVCRGLAGLALGAFPPLVITYLTELLPARQRGALILATVALATLGPPAGIFLVRGLTLTQWVAEPWRWALGFGGVGAGVVGLLFLLLPESPRWLHSVGRNADAERALDRFDSSRPIHGFGASVVLPVAPVLDGLAASPRRRWPLVAALFFLSPWSTVAFPLLAGAVFAQKGFKIADSLLFIGLSAFGPLVGTLLAAFGVDRLDRRLALAACAAAMLLAGVAFVGSDVPAGLIVAGAVFGMFLSVYVSALNLYGAELFPTRARASSLASAWAMNRVGAAVAPLLLLPLLREQGPPAMFVLIAAALLAGIGLLFVAPRGQQRRPVV